MSKALSACKWLLLVNATLIMTIREIGSKLAVIAAGVAAAVPGFLDVLIEMFRNFCLGLFETHGL